jgi:hypothetical protein
MCFFWDIIDQILGLQWTLLISSKTCLRHIEYFMRFEVLTAMKMSMLVFWFVPSWGLPTFRRKYCLHLQGWSSSALKMKAVRNVGIYLQVHTALPLRRSTLTPWITLSRTTNKPVARVFNTRFLMKTLSHLYGIRWFITVFRNVRHVTNDLPACHRPVWSCAWWVWLTVGRSLVPIPQPIIFKRLCTSHPIYLISILIS